jgi:hypothetical protein
MNTTVVVDGDLLDRARRYSNALEDSELVKEVFTAFIRREAGQRLADLGGTMPDAWAPPRRRWDP